MRVDQQLVLRDRHPPAMAPPKTDASVRTVPLPEGVAHDLASHLAEFPTADISGYGRLLFTNDLGEPLRRDRFREVWRPAVRRAGVREDLTFHDLRHYYASLLIRHGESVKVVQRRLGHKTAQETLDTYGHLWPDPTIGPGWRSILSCSGEARLWGNPMPGEPNTEAPDGLAGRLSRPGRGLCRPGKKKNRRSEG